MQTTHLPSASKSTLLQHRNELIIEKMKIDKFFSVFLDKHDLTEENTCTPEWHTYKAMLKNYENIQSLLNTTDYYIKKHYV
jgi:hypothetical protein